MNSLKKRMQHRWDQQMAADASSGKLDRLLQKVSADIEANRIKPLVKSFTTEKKSILFKCPFYGGEFCTVGKGE